MTRSRLPFYKRAATLSLVCLMSTALASHAVAAESDIMPSAPVMSLHETVLTFTTHGEAKAVPNLLTIHFTARAQSTSPATAQKRLNQIVSTAVNSLKNDGGATLHAGNYSLSQEYSEHPPHRWNATQTLTLKGNDSGHLLTLAEALQSQGLALDDMDWSLDPQTQQTLEAQARTAALKKIRQQADSDASALGLRVVGIERVQVGAGPLPEPRFGLGAPAPMLMSARSAGPAPQSTPEEQTISVSASAHIRLAPENAPPLPPHTPSAD
ncbi:MULTISPECIES: SIMPL domain-containing protein [unclassified Saccharibacter]|uniref:SIMPL domain-containing protein n=1 Tax=unclassified Saccharibacter TaxID=2648722 RepID=UPI001320E847|nr:MULTISPECIES: SIMPL domain-containing protein [unclassified Saccharibacter]MXV37036.1 DUF541 domain-containing protein [Saccharibacter sp. EH611]MXV58474.1 DUF541 domain-containing protein [Saccharibacter sp. EH70]MXV65980.1 DUF541 domain-containing protein [Saccharibacter sp. EH60]